MKRSGLIVATLTGLFLVTAAEAGPKGNNGTPDSAACPPGLAKKNPPCVPPGQAKKRATAVTPEAASDGYVVYGPGDFLPEDYIVLINPWIYRPDLNAIYVRFGGYLYLIDRDGGFVLDRIGPVADWTWSWANTDFANCPPGLAKKNPPCVPPGQAKKGVTARAVSDGQFDPFGIGDVLPDGYAIVIDPALFPANDNARYVRQGDTLYRADTTTGEVLDQISNVGRLIE